MILDDFASDLFDTPDTAACGLQYQRREQKAGEGAYLVIGFPKCDRILFLLEPECEPLMADYTTCIQGYAASEAPDSLGFGQRLTMAH